MSWWKNQKVRHDAKKAGLPRPRTGGIGDRIGEALDAKVDESNEKLEAKRAEKAARDDERDG
jgi:hypothetical protein